MTIHRKVPVTLQNGVTPTFVTFDFAPGERNHIALLFPGWDTHDAPLVRLHSECLTGDVFGSQRCDCQAQLHEAIDLMSKNGGVLLYLRQEGRGIGLKAKLDAYDLQIREHLDTFEANLALGHPEDLREYGTAAQMLKDIGATKITLLTNNPQKISDLQANGIDIAEVRHTGVHTSPGNKFYLEAKRRRGHALK